MLRTEKFQYETINFTAWPSSAYFKECFKYILNFAALHQARSHFSVSRLSLDLESVTNCTKWKKVPSAFRHSAISTKKRNELVEDLQQLQVRDKRWKFVPVYFIAKCSPEVVTKFVKNFEESVLFKASRILDHSVEGTKVFMGWDFIFSALFEISCIGLQTHDSFSNVWIHVEISRFHYPQTEGGFRVMNDTFECCVRCCLTLGTRLEFTLVNGQDCIQSISVPGERLGTYLFKLGRRQKPFSSLCLSNSPPRSIKSVNLLLQVLDVSCFNSYLEYQQFKAQAAHRKIEMATESDL